MAVTISVVILRLAVRTWVKQWTFWLSDIFLVLAVLLFLSLVVGDTLSFALGFDSFDTTYFDEGYAKVCTHLEATVLSSVWMLTESL